MTARCSPALAALAALAAALVALPRPGAADAGDVPQPPPDAPVAPAQAAEPVATGAPASGFGPVRPILLAGAGPVGGGALTLGADLGLRVAPVTARFSWRGEFFHSGDDLTFPSGRIGWIFLERRWIAGHAGIGAGRLTRTFDDTTRGSASALAVVAEAGALLAPSDLFGPALALQVEALAPVGSRSPPGARLTAPVLSAVVSVNLLDLLVWQTRRSPW